ncbi:hypothetical protein, partial [Aeromonas salmonicida]|uniref:hypothetical protein n=1 Tax=Aeromonas salmonicida TaxID=645 RepID=UPI003D311ABA
MAQTTRQWRARGGADQKKKKKDNKKRKEKKKKKKLPGGGRQRQMCIRDSAISMATSQITSSTRSR